MHAADGWESSDDTVGEATVGDQLSREALAAALPELAHGTADLVGWVARGGHDSSSATLTPEPARHLLSAALGVPEGALAAMGDDDVLRAVDRIRGLADHCRRLAGQVTVDSLTGTFRRGAGLAAMQREIDRSRRLNGDGGLVVLFLDIDGLKIVNDRDGHAAGDELLRATVAALRERLRSYDMMIRYGGDEFICVLTGTHLAQAERTAAGLREHVLARTGNGITTGLAELAGNDTVDSLVARADEELYRNRRARGANAASSQRTVSHRSGV